MGSQSLVTLKNWEKISGEHQKLYKNFLGKGGQECSPERAARICMKKLLNKSIVFNVPGAVNIIHPGLKGRT